MSDVSTVNGWEKYIDERDVLKISMIGLYDILTGRKESGFEVAN
jgi:hypothetical protein